MMWWILENWFPLGLIGAYIAAVGFAYVRFGREAAIAVALLGAGAFIYRHGRHAEKEAQRRRSEASRQTRLDVEDEIENLGEQNVDERLKRWNRD